jgi:NAD(P)H-hydrate repair Nnr-like enzyme with NAD(P)H-hydrate dehydratase domain
LILLLKLNASYRNCPGLGQEIETKKCILSVLKTNKAPLVIDDALNILSKIKNGFL